MTATHTTTRSVGAGADGSVYDKLISITHSYLGSAADPLIANQVKNHLHKLPQELSQDDLLSLIDWIRVVVSLLTEDDVIIAAYAEELRCMAIANDTATRT